MFSPNVQPKVEVIKNSTLFYEIKQLLKQTTQPHNLMGDSRTIQLAVIPCSNSIFKEKPVVR
jgi:hypothetical protein